MKIQCDVCNKDEASVFCSADEAALCDSCDRRVHHANKLAEKHHRFSLLHPSSSDSPLCDICQEKRAFLFCKEDRAILCRDCDHSIHTVNELTKKHNRFLLTGVKLSATSSIFTSTTTTTSTSKKTLGTKSRSSEISLAEQQAQYTTVPTSIPNYDDINQTKFGGSTSSISEYLGMLPGYQVEDLLDSSLAPITSYNDFSKNEDLFPFFDSSSFDQTNNMGCSPSDDFALWVPEIPLPPQNQNQNHLTQIEVHKKNGSKNTAMTGKMNKRENDHGFTVPQINPQSYKRSRQIW